MPISNRFISDGKSAFALKQTQESALKNLLGDIGSGRISFSTVDCLCGQGIDNAFEIAQKDLHGLPLNVYLCKKCGLIYASPYFDMDSASIFYMEYYRDLYEGALVSDINDRFRKQKEDGELVLKFITETRPVSEIKDVLEIGCAAGGLLDIFRNAECDVTGLDLDDRFLDFGKNRGLNLIKNSFEHYAPTALNKHDLVILNNVFEHLHSPGHILNLIKDTLRPDGLLYIQVPNMDLSYIELEQFQLAHKWYFDELTVTDLLERSGFKVISIQSPHHMDILAALNNEGNSTIRNREVEARQKYERGRRFERYAPLLPIIRALRIGKVVKFFYKFIS